ncbi:MAG TPA: hypothetical protein VJI74_00085 [Candidatus Paceibacterota bacterium]
MATNDLETLTEEIKAKTLKARFLGEDGAVALEKKRMALFQERHKRTDSLGAASSTFYAAAVNTGAGFKKHPWKFWLAPQARKCFKIALKLSDEFEGARGIEAMTADELDVRQTILRRALRFKDAERCIIKGLTYHDASAHTQALLHLGQAEAGIGLKRNPQISLETAERMIPKIKDLNQAVRVYRGCARVYDELGKLKEAKRLRAEASQLAKSQGLPGQELLIEIGV